MSVTSLDHNDIVSVHNGADDNASGTVAVLELARRLRIDPPRRSILFVHFGAEEIGLVGSAVFVHQPPVPLATFVAMINLDMVGRLRSNRLSVYGLKTAPEFRALVDSAGGGLSLKVSAIKRPDTPSDHLSFVRKRIPALHLFTGLHPDFHRPTDDVERINLAGLMEIVDFSERLLRLIADRDERLASAEPRSAGDTKDKSQSP